MQGCVRMPPPPTASAAEGPGAQAAAATGPDCAGAHDGTFSTTM